MNTPSVFPPTLIRASAGTGKTFQLTNRFIALLAAGEKPERILATTFTRKAAGEIHTRVVQRIASAAASQKDAQELGDFIGIPGFSSQDATVVLQQLVDKQHRLRICTLDSFCVQIARCFSLELGLLPGWRILDEATWRRLKRESVRDLCSIPDSREFVELMRLLNKGDVRRSVQARIEEQIGSIYGVFLDARPEAWSWLSAPEPPPTKEVKAALQKLEAFEVPETGKGEPNSHWQKALSRSRDLFLAENWREFVKVGLVTRVIQATAGEVVLFATKPISADLVKIFQPLIQHSSSILIGEIVNQTRALSVLLNLFDQSYRSLKEAEGGVEFGDIKRLISESSLFGTMLEVYYRLDSSIGHVLLDEFQDTSRDEWLIVEPIVEEILASADGESSFFCVGDVKQAIYGWRGGVAHIFESLQQRWPHLSPEPLDTSFRSSPVIMQFINAVFEDLENNPALEAVSEAARRWQSGFRLHRTARTELDGFVSMACHRVDENGEYCPAESAAQVVQSVQVKTPAATIGVLVRTNQEVAQIGLALTRIGISASGEGGSYITDSCAVNVVLALFYLVDHPGDSISAFHLSCSALGDFFGLNNYRDTEQIHQVRTDVLKAINSNGYGRTVSEYVRYLEAFVDVSERRRLAQLKELAFAFDKNQGARVEEFIRFIEQQKIDDASADQVRVMTVHQSKGLEFDVVVLPDLDGSLDRSSLEKLLLWRNNPIEPPCQISSFTGQEVRALDPRLVEMHSQGLLARIEEELSLLYVALTRARQCLQLLIAPKKRRSGFPLSAAGVLRAALTPDKQPVAGESLFEMGDVDWWRSFESEEVADKASEGAIEFPVLKQGVRKRGLAWVSPSQCEGGQLVDGSESFMRSQSAFRRGTALHSLFELVEWDPGDGVAEREITRALKRCGISDPNSIDIYRTEFLKMLSGPSLCNLFCRDRYTATEELRVEREYPFAIRLEGTLLSGVIDRLVLCSSAGEITHAEIIDFKSDDLSLRSGGSVDTKRLAERKKYYLPQMEAYCSAVHLLFGVAEEKIVRTLVFVAHDLVCEV